MRFQKSREPREIRQWRKANPTETDWKALSSAVKEAMRDALARDQQDSCCYCHGPAEPNSRIEHIVARDGVNTFAWENLALACSGAEGFDASDHHCDKRKGSRRLRIVHPYKNPVVSLVRVRLDGHLKGHAEDDALREDIEETLNLNGRRPVSARRRALDSALAELPKDRQWSAERVVRLLDVLRARNQPIPYQAWVEQWLESKRSAR